MRQTIFTFIYIIFLINTGRRIHRKMMHRWKAAMTRMRRGFTPRFTSVLDAIQKWLVDRTLKY
jgi:hypothetical protein